METTGIIFNPPQFLCQRANVDILKIAFIIPLNHSSNYILSNFFKRGLLMGVNLFKLQKELEKKIFQTFIEKDLLDIFKSHCAFPKLFNSTC